jgi:Ca-activated chloride channel family protein
VGTGKQIRQQTLLRLAEYGRGAAAFAGDSDSLEAAVDELYASISQPIGWDVKLAFEGGDVEEIVPERLPDLYAGRPVRVLAWFRDDLPSTLSLKMSTMEGERYYNVQLPPPVP